MTLESIKELHYIAPIANLDSIFNKGILSHNAATPHKKADISMDGVQEIRAKKIIPAEAMGEARTIHDCANVYFNAKNPMLSTRRKENTTFCVLRLKPELLKEPNAVIADRNAAVKEARFTKVAEGINTLATKVLFGQFWTSKYQSEEINKTNGQLRCAELLLPRTIHQSFIGGIYVVSEAVKLAVLDKFPKDSFPEGCPVPITVKPSFFFNSGQDEIPAPLDNRLYPNPIPYVPNTTVEPLKEREIIDLTGEEKPATAAKIEALELKSVPLESSPKKGGLYNWLVPKKPQGDAPVVKPSTIPLPANITIKKGNLLDSPMQTIVNTVNCKGVMGKGIAEQFKKRYPTMFDEYKERCEAEKVKPGVPYTYKIHDTKTVLNFPTKDNWRQPSQYIWIQKGLDRIKEHYKEWGITSIALPPLGCGQGGLNWKMVRSMIIGTLGDIGIPVEIYEGP